MEDVKKAFEEHVDAALEPEDYPGDETVLFLEDEGGTGASTTIPARERWRIEDRDGAAWALRRYRRAQAMMAEASALAAKLREAADAFERDAMAGPVRDLAFFEGKLREFHAVEISKPGVKGKTVKLPGGRLKGSVGGVSAVLDPEAKDLIPWLDEHAPDLVVRPPAPDPRPDLAGLKKAFGVKVSEEPGEYPAADENGEVVPGVTLVRGEPSFSIDLDEEVA